MYQIPAKEWRSGILLLLGRKLGYWNKFPYNCGLYDGTTLWGDCWCMFPKTMIWSCAVGQPVWENYVIGENHVRMIYEKGIEKSGLPDWGGDNLYWNFCTPVSFYNMVRSDDPALLLIDGEHMGTYIGEFYMDGKTYNTAEFAPNPYINNTMRSYVDAQGLRYDYKGGHCLGAWSRAGYFAGIDYTVKPDPVVKPYSIQNLAVHMMRGEFGNGEARKKAVMKLGYTEAEVDEAQDIIDTIYERRDRDLLAAEIAMRLIAGEGGDGVTLREQWVEDTYGDRTLFRLAQDKVNLYLE
ncbi:MAG: hypothetical protein J6S41_07720, partial [Clostridia bacterium]|nr:hypothetical protein [Clostridia bacterium]